MARLVGRVRFWLWWVAGLVCALLFGGRARGDGGPDCAAGPTGAAAGDEQSAARARAEQLVDDYLSPPVPAEVPAQTAREVAKLIADFSAEDFKVREAASAAVVRHGAAALGALRKAAASGDAEVASRAEAAIAAIEAECRKARVAELLALRDKSRAAVQEVVDRRHRELAMAAQLAEQAFRKAEQEGTPEEVEKARALARSTRERGALMARLYRQIMPPLPPPPYGMLRRIPVTSPRGTGGGAGDARRGAALRA